MISAVSPIYNEAENIPELIERVTAALESTGEDFEVVLVDNGSRDASLELIRAHHEKDPRVRWVSLSRNFGHQGGVLAGLSHAVGDAVISLDGDLQHPPELIPKMVELWKAGHDVVYTTKDLRGEPWGWRIAFARIFYRLLSRISDVELSVGQSDFRLMARPVVDLVCREPEQDLFIRGFVEWVGFSQAGISYRVGERKRGESKFSFWSYLRFAVSAILSFSNLPLRLFLLWGVLLALVCGLYAVGLSVLGLIHLVRPEIFSLPPGWATIAVSILFLSSVQLIGIGMLGEYISRIFLQTKKRPNFIVRAMSTAAMERDTIHPRR